MQQAGRAFRWSATEYAGEEGRPPDPDHQDAPAMRPALAALDDRQRTALDRLLEGFETPAGLGAWARVVVESSYAEIDAVTLRPLYFELPLRERLVGPAAAGDRFVRETWALRYLLPAFNGAAGRGAARGAEVAESGRALTRRPGRRREASCRVDCSVRL